MLKSLTLFLSLYHFLFSPMANAARGEIPVVVKKFENRSSESNCRYDWQWWGKNLGAAFSEILIDELEKNPRYSVLERENIKEIYGDEFDLVNSEASDTKLEKGKFEKARYVFLGAVTQFEYCIEKSGGTVDISALAALAGHSIPSLGLGFNSSKTHVQVVIRVVDTTTGRIVKSVKGESQQSDRKVNLDTDYFTVDDQKTSPIGKTIQAAIADGVSKIHLL